MICHKTKANQKRTYGMNLEESVRAKKRKFSKIILRKIAKIPASVCFPAVGIYQKEIPKVPIRMIIFFCH